MDSFEQMGEAQLLALEGQRQIAVAVVGLLKKAFLSMFNRIPRSAPDPFLP